MASGMPMRVATSPNQKLESQPNRRRRRPPSLALESPRCIIDIAETPSQNSVESLEEHLPDTMSKHLDTQYNVLFEGDKDYHWTISRMGRKRTESEDAAAFERQGTDWFFYGVFDGHSGRVCADYTARNIASRFFTSAEFRSRQILDALEQTFLTLDHDFVTFDGDSSGTTAAVVVLRRGVLWVAHVGDSRVVLSRQGRAMVLTEDHRATRESEAERIEQAGGFVLMKRVQGVLAVSRSIGDSEYKEYITAQPDTTRRSIARDDEFLILATDGLWDVVSEQEAVDMVRETQGGLDYACERLMNEAQARGSGDDITVSVVSLAHHRPGSPRSPSGLRSPVSPRCSVADANYRSWTSRNGLLLEISNPTSTS